MSEEDVDQLIEDMGYAAIISELDPSKISVDDLKLGCTQMSELNKSIKEAERRIDEDKALLYQMKVNLKKILQSLSLEEFHFPGGSVELKKETKISGPASDSEDKLKFLAYLQDNELLHLKLVNINARSLNSWYKQEAKIAMEEGRILDIPGLGFPTEYIDIKLK